MWLKAGVRVLGIRPEVLLAVLVADSVYRGVGADLVVTSAVDGTHRRASLHYAGYAVDLRLPPADVEAVAVTLRRALGVDYDVVVEPDHLHVEYQPKAPY